MQETELPPPTEEELAELEARYGDLYVPTDQIDEYRREMLLQLRAERAAQ